MWRAIAWLGITLAVCYAQHGTIDAIGFQVGNDRELLTANTANVADKTETTGGKIRQDPAPTLKTAMERDTEHGKVVGRRWRDEATIAFFDIPYGNFTKPFAAPIKPLNWTEPQDNREHSKQCPQLQPPYDKFEVVGSHDCLTLSVFTPENPENAEVLFHIYDGNFNSGSADPAIYGPETLVSKNIILVLPNYRIGPLGFLCMRNETASGNAALKDLALALKWTKNNIANFGGNPDKIVVSGDGTAGALAGYLALATTTRNLISGVITESGSVLAHWALDRDPIDTATKLARAMGKPVTENADVSELVIKANGLKFVPCVEVGSEGFITETPWQLLTKDENISIPFMIGSANHAGMHEAADSEFSEFNEYFMESLPNDLEFKNDSEMKEMGNRIWNQYFETNLNMDTDSENVSLYYTDASYLGPALRTARLLVESGTKVYFYEFSYVGELNRERNSLMERVKVNGAARGDIVGYTFMQEDTTVTESDDKMVNFVTDLWVQFVKNGTPLATNIEWKPMESTEETKERWLSIEAESKVHNDGIHTDRIALWTEIYKSHYVEHNLAFTFIPSRVLMLSAMFLISLQIFNYSPL